MSLGNKSKPPVSTSRNGCYDHSVSAIPLSRVVPAKSDTIDWRLPVNLLKSVDLPTLGLPTIATVGFIDVASWWFKLSVPLLGWIYPVLLTKYQSITLVTKEFCKNGFLCVKSVFSLMIYNRIGMFQHTI